MSAAHYAAVPLPERPRLASWLVAIDLGDDRLQLRSAESVHTLTHPLLARVFRAIEPMLDGRHTVDEILASAGSDVMPTTTIFVLKLLQGRGLLQRGDNVAPLDVEQDALFRFLGHYTTDPGAMVAAIAQSRVAVIGAPSLADQIVSELAAIGLDCGGGTATNDGYDLVLACADGPAMGFFEEVNREHLATRTRWTRIALYGTTAQLGPTVIPGETACHACFERRLLSHQPEREGYAAYRARVVDGTATDEGVLTPLASLLASQAALETIRLLTAFAPAATIGRFCEWTAASPLAVTHDVLKVPRCHACGRRRTFSQAWDEVPDSQEA
ncbi:MAG TPA: TOMM precursor leader peptide-binding protein [Gaiellaceae bacterium]|nr:TOMM precursor leader peptide-binding protein [Gaiellaceae bacterium]